MPPVKVVVLGGSGVATPELASAIASSPGRTQRIELVLVGRNLDKLETVAGVTRLLAGQDPLLEISHTTDVAAALTGADYVINQVRVGGLEARAFDESFPRDLGIPGEETMGPGGFANASRTVPVVLQYARLIERVAPTATMLTFANPSSLVQYAVTRYTRVAAIGLCDSPISLIAGVAKALGVSAASLTVDYVGMHHFGWITAVWWEGSNVLPDALAKAGEICPDIAPEIVQAIGAIPSSYLRYVYHPDRILAKVAGHRTRAEDLIELQDEILAEYATCLQSGRKPSALSRRGARWYSLIIAPVLLALVEGRCSGNEVHSHRFTLNVVNGQTVPWLPPDAIVEAPVLVHQGMVEPLSTGSAPPDIVGLVRANCAYEMLAAEAIVERDRAKALRALLSNPMIHTHTQAVAVLDRVWNKV